ncbi:MAG: polyprenyl synthetase family protein, partial [Chloroflexota bacterium]
RGHLPQRTGSRHPIRGWLMSQVRPPGLLSQPGSMLERFAQPMADALQQALPSHTSPFYEMLRYHLGLDDGASSGKQLRPTLCLLVCEALGGDWRTALPAAASIELIHNFSLIHDDIQDGDRERRHRPTVWAKWGVGQAINAGDAMCCLAMLALNRFRQTAHERLMGDVLGLLSEATREIIEGQYLDLSYEALPQITLDQYRDMIQRKTGALIRASAEVGALLATTTPQARLLARDFGELLGKLFQVQDDLLGVWGAPGATGKPVSADIRRKKKSLPIVLALTVAPHAERLELSSIYGQESLGDDDVLRVHTLLDGLQIRARVEGLADEAYGQTIEKLEALGLDDASSADLGALVRFVRLREH